MAMAIGAHPDDVEFGCGATLARWAAAGTRIHHLICTDGSKGTWDPSANLPELVRRRQEEQRAASRCLGGTGEVTFLGRIDGELANDAGARSEVVAAIRTVRPDVILGHDPWKRYRLHPDHRAAGWLTIDGIVAARDPHFLPELGLERHRPSALLLFEADEVDHVEPAEPQHLRARIAALEAHRSQFETTHYHRVGGAGSGLDPAELHAEFVDRERRLLAEAGHPFGVALGEVFKLMDDL
ncbi:MAG: PIG-L family deacetylase [Candidatus Microthrix sp.]|uniref:PIG-L family deacetylase n=2 Tax=Candidatus Neomicrothrix TaxID=41949 RepID=A0A936TE38_9ACTN|nr:PIG-L family deacetylase [Candidatus Microthrix subdominans]